MGDADAAAIRAARGDWVSEHLEIYLTSGGTRGHIMDVSAVGGRALTTHCLIKCLGRKSAKVHVSVDLRQRRWRDRDRRIERGADTHPGWYLNVLESNTIGVQIATKRSRPRGGNQKARNGIRCGPYGSAVPAVPHLSQQSTSRQIPLVMLTPVRPIDVFSAEDSQ
jgi:hypothetical protein